MYNDEIFKSEYVLQLCTIHYTGYYWKLSLAAITVKDTAVQ